MKQLTLWYLLTGLITGICSALFGIGGGLILIPVLVLLFHTHMKEAAALSLAAVVPITLVNAFSHIAVNHVFLDFSTILTLVVFALIGSWFGVHAAHIVSHKLLVRFFSVLLFFLALRMANILDAAPLFSSQVQIIPLALTGLLIGFTSGLFGISGGVVLVPVLTQIFDFSIISAVATSAVCVAPIAFFGAWQHHTKGALNKQMLYTIVPAAFVGIFIGILLLTFLSTSVLQLLFGFLLFFVSIRLFFSRNPKHS